MKEEKIYTTEELVAGGEDIRIRQMSAEICDLFEELLDRFDITIPSDDREGNEDEARLYGDEYYALEESVTACLADFANIVRKYNNKPLNTEEL